MTLAIGVVLSSCGGNGNNTDGQTPPPYRSTIASSPSAVSSPVSRMPGDTEGATPVSSVESGSTPTSGYSTDADLAEIAKLVPGSSIRCDPVSHLSKSGNSRFMDLDELIANTNCAIGQFSWPPGRTPDARKIIANADYPDQSVFEAGMEYNIAQGAFMCGWKMAWLDAHENGDAQLIKLATRMIFDVYPNLSKLIPGFPEIYAPGVIEGEMKRLQPVLLGDPTIIQFDVEYACQHDIWVTS